VSGVSDDAKPPIDVVIGVGATDDGDGVKVVRLRDARPDEATETRTHVMELGEVRRMQSERVLPAGGEIVKLAPREDGAFDVEVVVPRLTSGPAQVATPAYRANWAATFSDDDADVN